MTAEPYTALEIPPVDYGDTARIALTVTFDGVMKARDEGFHVAFMRNAQTLQWLKWMKFCVDGGLLDRLAAQSEDNFLRERVENMRWRTLRRVEREMERDLGAVDATGIIKSFSSVDPTRTVHTDLVQGAFGAVFTTLPTTHIHVKLPVYMNQQFNVQTGQAEFTPLRQLQAVNDPRSPTVSPKEGSVIFMFAAGNHGHSVGHAAPSDDAHPDGTRASIVSDGAFPVSRLS